MQLRPATDADVPAIVALANLAYRAVGPGAGWNSEGEIIGGQRTDEVTLRADLAASPDALLLLHEEEGEILASVWLEPLEAGAWYLGLLTVRPDLQDRKLGRGLLAAAEETAKARGATRICMSVVNVRDTLIAWYERRGYGLTGETQPFPYGDERFGLPLRDDLHFVVLEKPL